MPPWTGLKPMLWTYLLVQVAKPTLINMNINPLAPRRSCCLLVKKPTSPSSIPACPAPGALAAAVCAAALGAEASGAFFSTGCTNTANKTTITAATAPTIIKVVRHPKA